MARSVQGPDSSSRIKPTHHDDQKHDQKHRYSITDMKNEENIEFPEFEQRVTTNKEELRKLYDKIIELLIERDAKIESLEAALGDANQQLEEKEEQIDELFNEKNQMQRVINHFAVEQANNSNRNFAPTATPEPVAQKYKSVKIPDPPVLTDGKDPKFEPWLSRMRNKLKANADHYNTEELRMTYVENRVDGIAASHLSPRLRPDAVNPYTSAEEMFKHLETIFMDPNKEANARREFRVLDMKPNESFPIFLTNFMRLANEAKVSESNFKKELYQRITWELKKLTMREWLDNAVSFEGYVTACTQFADQLQVINEERSRNQWNTKRTNSSITASPTSTGTSTRTDEFRRERTLVARSTPERLEVLGTPIDSTEREKLMKDGRCFLCKDKGHIAPNCPRKQRAAEVKLLERASLEKENGNNSEKY
jgi:hypothetical protein